jgi:SNF2 family DNA or RNA helicase
MPIWRHQEDAIAWAWSRPWAIWHHGMGSGKTRTTLELIKRWLAEHGGSRILVCCPKAVIAAWVKQVSLWAPHIRVVALDKASSAAKEKAFQAAIADTSPVIIVCNYESVWRIKGIEKAKWDFLVWDEVHRLKSASGVASRWAGKMTKANPQAKRLGLSGTLIPHSILDAWAIYRSVEYPMTVWNPSFTLHKAEHAVLSNGVQRFIVGYKNLDQAHKKIAATTHHVRSCDVLDLPPITFEDVPCELSPQEAKLYREVETELCAVCESGSVTPKNALEQLLRIQQICGGFVRFDGEAAARQIAEHPAKAATLADRLQDLPTDEPLVVFCRFTSDIAAAKAAALADGRAVSELSGQANELADWQAGKTNTLITQIQSGGIGVDMTRCGERNCCYAFFYSLGYSLAEYEQAVARLHRPGQEKKVFIYHLVATINGRATVDGRVYEALRERKEVVDVIIRGYSRHNTTAGAR